MREKIFKSISEFGIHLNRSGINLLNKYPVRSSVVFLFVLEKFFEAQRMDEKLKRHSYRYCAVSSGIGERRIRVHTLCLPVVSSLADVYVGADVQAVLCLLANMGELRLHFRETSPCLYQVALCSKH